MRHSSNMGLVGGEPIIGETDFCGRVLRGYNGRSKQRKSAKHGSHMCEPVPLVPRFRMAVNIKERTST